MAIWVGGFRLPGDRSYRYEDPASDTWFQVTQSEGGVPEIALHVCGQSGAPALRASHSLLPYRGLMEEEDGALLSMLPMPYPQPELPEAIAEDLLVAVIGYGPSGELVFEVGHDGLRAHSRLTIRAL